MKRFFSLLILISMSKAIIAQSARDSVMAAVNDLFEAMKKADTVLLKNCFSPNAVMQTIQDNKGIVKVSNETVADFIAFVGKEAVGAADEQIVFETIIIDGTLATAWTPYKFYYKGNFSHCGVNSFQLVRLNSGWKIQYIIDTRRKEGCR
jgi:Putative lumazine-binding